MSTEFIPSGHIGYRLAHELEGLLMGIRADGVIHDLERDRLQRWVDINEPCAHLKPFSELRLRVQAALADGVLTLEECDDLLFVTQKLTTVNPYFGAIRTGIQIMLGHLAGIAADGTIRDVEMRAVARWSEDWSHLAGLWPFDEVVALVTSLQSGGAPPAECYAKLREVVDTFPLSGEYEGSWPPPIIQGVCAVDPKITFEGKRFVFTGESSRCPRAELEIRVVDRGGKAAKNVSQKTHYLVVCDDGSPHWAFSCYGRKVEEAYNLRRDGHPIVIVHEVDFWDATR